MSISDAQADLESALESLMESGEQVVFSYKTDLVFDNDTRITSYNVCYTKLLRFSFTFK